MANCFLVLGTPRSGTSLVAGVLHHLGVRMGEEIEPGRWDWAPANEWNQKGFFQDSAFLNFGQDVYGFPPTHERLLTSTQRGTLAGIIAKRAGGVEWGVSEPMTMALWLRDFIELCPDRVKLLVTKRSVERSIASWRARTDEWPADCIPVIQAAMEARPVDVPVMAIGFDDLIDNPAKMVSAIADFVGRPATAEALAFPEPSLRRF